MQIACNLGPKVASPTVNFYIEICSFRCSSSAVFGLLKKAGFASQDSRRIAARMVFALSCTSAAAERVFFLVDAMFGEDQRTCLADQVQVGVMLRYNKRMVGYG